MIPPRPLPRPEAIARRWFVAYSTSAARSGVWQQTEAAIHELCHAAGFGFDPFDDRRQAIDHRIGGHFLRMKNLGLRQRCDANEADAAASEILVLRAMGAANTHVNLDTLITGVHWLTRNITPARARRIVYARLADPRVVQHAITVLGWLRRLHALARIVDRRRAA